MLETTYLCAKIEVMRGYYSELMDIVADATLDQSIQSIKILYASYMEQLIVYLGC